MPTICYKPKNFTRDVTSIIAAANKLIRAYMAQGFGAPTVRQVYYQFIAHDLFPADWIDPTYNTAHGLPEDTKNTQKNYKRLAGILNDARLAGQIDWHYIEDRTRNLQRHNTWDSVADILEGCANGYRVDKWEGQTIRPEVWVEKDAALGVIERVCGEYQLPYYSCRGSNSQSEMWGAAMRFQRMLDEGLQPLVIHVGDHDPTGLDCTRDIEDRLGMFLDCGRFEIKRVALNMSQIDQYNPPPNPAKTTDSRYAKYAEQYGDDSWELDALEPRVLAGLVEDAVLEVLDQDAWDARVLIEDEGKERLAVLADNERNPPPAPKPYDGFKDL